MRYPIEFAKMSGAGNDFVMIDNRDGAVTDPAALAATVCLRRMSVGADGLILVEDSSVADVRMVYFNSDGSRADFCANGTRCAARFAVLSGLASPKLTLETDAGVVPAEVTSDRVTLNLGTPRDYTPNLPLDLWPETRLGSRIVVGVPHWVTFVEKNLWGMDVVTPGRAARFHEKLKPAGANINFVCVKSRSRLEVRTYERGVEDETLSCGSGTVAAVSVAALKRLVVSPVTVLTRSGMSVEVSFLMNNGMPDDVQLTGDARVIYRGAITQETIGGFDAAWVRNPTSSLPRT